VGGLASLPWLDVPDAAAPGLSLGRDVPALGVALGAAALELGIELEPLVIAAPGSAGRDA
jgi:hypothetical protein